MTSHSAGKSQIPALILGVIVLIAMGVAVWFFGSEKVISPNAEKQQKNNASQTNQTSPTEPPPEPKPKEEVTLMPISGIASTLNSPETDVETDLSTLRTILREFRRQYQDHPTGENIEITAALMGDNTRSLGFIPKLGKHQINAQGELIDRWGTPYFFHVESSTRLEIRSAGKDGKHYTKDDTISSPDEGE